MSKQATETVTFPDSNGELVTVTTDIDTAKAIKEYKGIYNQIQYYNITSQTLNNPMTGQICEIYQAQSKKMKIVCMKKYIPLIGDESYECGIVRKKHAKPELVFGGVELLYYKLLHGRAK